MSIKLSFATARLVNYLGCMTIITTRSHLLIGACVVSESKSDFSYLTSVIKRTIGMLLDKSFPPRNRLLWGPFEVSVPTRSGTWNKLTSLITTFQFVWSPLHILGYTGIRDTSWFDKNVKCFNSSSVSYLKVHLEE